MKMKSQVPRLLRGSSNSLKKKELDDKETSINSLVINEVMTSNEVRQKMGLMPSKDPKADELINSNIRQPDDNNRQNQNVTEDQEEGGNIQNGTEQYKL